MEREMLDSMVFAGGWTNNGKSNRLLRKSVETSGGRSLRFEKSIRWRKLLAAAGPLVALMLLTAVVAAVSYMWSSPRKAMAMGERPAFSASSLESNGPAGMKQIDASTAVATAERTTFSAKRSNADVAAELDKYFDRVRIGQ